jgi:hypothetical protein
VVVAAAVAAPAAALAVPLHVTPIRAKPPPVNERSPSQSASAFAWVQNTRSHPHLSNAYAQVNGGPRIRVNAAGTQAGVGTGIEGNTVVYTQIRQRRFSIRLFNLVTRGHGGPPKGVNTPHIEDEPSASGPWILFHRQATGRWQKVLLANRVTGAIRVIAKVPGRGFLEAGQVNGNWAVFTKSATGSSFNVWRYDIAHGTLVLVPNPGGKLHSAPAVNPQGTVYFEESGRACGANVTVDEYPVGGPVSPIGTLPAGIDIFHPTLFENGTGDHYEFARLHCTSGASDIYESAFS